jgi:hypothetical protein
MNKHLMIHDQTLPTFFTNIECNIRTNKKGHQNVQIWFQWIGLNFIFLQSIVMGARESETLTSTPNLGHYHLMLRLCLPKFPCIFTLWNLSDHDVTSIGLGLNRFKFKYFKLVPSWLQLLAILLIVVLILIFKVLLLFFSWL